MEESSDMAIYEIRDGHVIVHMMTFICHMVQGPGSTFVESHNPDGVSPEYIGLLPPSSMAGYFRGDTHEYEK